MNESTRLFLIFILSLGILSIIIFTAILTFTNEILIFPLLGIFMGVLTMGVLFNFLIEESNSNSYKRDQKLNGGKQK